MYMVGFYSHEAVKCCYITADGILCIQLVIGFIACRMLSHFMYFVRNDEIKMFNQKIKLYEDPIKTDVHMSRQLVFHGMGLLPDTQNCVLRMRRECRERFPHRQRQRKPLVSDPGMHHGTCVTRVPWCISGSLTHGGGENVAGIRSACTPVILRTWQEAHVRNFNLVRLFESKN